MELLLLTGCGALGQCWSVMSALQQFISKRPKGAVSDLASIAGVTPAQMSRIVCGKRGASVDVMLAISRATGLPLEVVVLSIKKRARQRKRERSQARG